MITLKVPIEVQEEIVEWCQYHYKENLAGLAFFDPEAVNPSYPKGDLNLLMLLREGPDSDRQRYDKVLKILARNLVRDKELLCRVQTVDEMTLLAEMELPLFNIYLERADIIYDPEAILNNMQRPLLG